MKIRIILTIFLFGTGLAWAGETPAVLAEFFGPRGIKDKHAAFYGEMLDTYLTEPTIGEALPRQIRVSFRPLKVASDQAVFAVLLSKGKTDRDWYAYLVKDQGRWKLSAVRTLTVLPSLKEELEELLDTAYHTAEEDWQYQNILLTFKSDGDLKSYMKKHRKEFQQVVDSLVNGDKASADSTARSLYIKTVNRSDGIVEFNITGTAEHAVGYLFLPEGKSPPELDPAGVIYIEKVTGNWYVFKTK